MEEMEEKNGKEKLTKPTDRKCPVCGGVVEEKQTCFAHCVRPRDCNPMAHGNITITETCKGCGRRREFNVNNNNIEKGKLAVEE